MSVAKNPKTRKKTDENVQVFCHEAQKYVGSKQKDAVDDTQSHQPKQPPNSKDRLNNNILGTKKKDFVIPRKKKQAKELLQSHRFDSRETKELLRSVQLSLRDPSYWSSYRFEKVEFVNNDNLTRKYGEKKQALRLETLRTNLEDKFAFLFTTSREEVKSICEQGLHTGNSTLTSLGDPRLGVYVCRFADVISKRQLTTEDAGYLLVFRVVKGKVRFIGGSNPELQPTPHHDCHVSKSLTTLSSKASHSDVFESSQLYFYEIDENSDDFHVKHPRQVLPYAVLTFNIIKSSERQQTKLDDKSEGKKAVSTGYDFPSSADENALSSPNRIESKDDVVSNANVSWSGVLAVNKKQLAYVDFLSYSRKKHPLPFNVDYFDICQKISHEELKSLLKCPVFRNGKPASTGVCIELNHGRKFIYYEVRVVNQVQEKFDEIVSHFVETKTAGVIEHQYFKGPVYSYFIPTSKLTNDIGITDRKSPLALHILVQVRHVRRLPSPKGTAPSDQEKKEDSGIDDTSLNEAIIKSQVQEIFKKKYENKQEKLDGKTKQNKLSALLSRRISLEDAKNVSDKPKSVLEGRRKSTDAKLMPLPEDASHEKRVQYQKDAQQWVDNFFSSARTESHSTVEKEESALSSDALTRKSKYKWVSPRLLKRSILSEPDSHDDGSIKTSRNEKENIPSKDTSNTDQGMDVVPASGAQPVHSDQDLGRNERLGVLPLDNTEASSLQSEKTKFEIDFLSVQKLIKEFQHFDKQGSSTVVTKSSGLVDPRLKRRSTSSSSQDKNADKPNALASVPPLRPLPIPPPPLPPPPPPPPPPMSPFLSAPLPQSSAAIKTPVSMTTTMKLSSATDLQRATSPVSPPAVKRREMMIPGLEPTGSPVFQLMREKVSFMSQSICTSASYLTDNVISTQSVTAWNQKHPCSPITISSSNGTPTRAVASPISTSDSKYYTTASENNELSQEEETRTSYLRDDSPKVGLSPPASNLDSAVKCVAQSDILDSDISEIPSYDNLVISRPLTEAEKNSSRAIQKIKNILLQNRDFSKNTSSEDDNNNGECRSDYQSGISRTLEAETEKDLGKVVEDIIPPTDEVDDEDSRKVKESSEKENIAKEYVIKGIRPIIEGKYVNEKDERKVDERNTSLKQPVKNLSVNKKTSVGTPDKQSFKLDSASSSPSTPELKSGLELLDNLISSQKRGHQPSPLTRSEPQRNRPESRGSNDSGRRSKSRSRETTPRKERSGEERKNVPPAGKRKVTIKRSKVNENKWDDMTSDISDTELPLDSDGYITENRRNKDGYRDHKASPRSRDVSRPSSRDGFRSIHHSDRYSKERTPTRRVCIGAKRDGKEMHRDYRDDHDDWDREWKRRKLHQEQAQETPEPSLHDDESTHSDSAMSISSLDSVSFEYAVPNDQSPCSNYRFVRTNSINGRSLEVTITRECPDRFPSHTNTDNVATHPYHTHLIPPSSPIEVDMTASSVMPDSPGTPETAVPSEDFLHTNIGYWSSGCATKEGADILPHDTDDSHFEPIQQESTEDSTYRNGRGTWSAPSSPYRGCGDDHDVSTARYEREELLIKKSRGEDCQRRPSSSGASTGYDYDNTGYKDRNQHTDPDFYRTMDRDGHSTRASNNTARCTDNKYGNLRDLSVIYPDRYSRTSDRYDDQGDHGLFYASKIPYEDIDSPRSIDCVEELGSNEKYYTSDRTDTYPTSNRSGSPLKISERLSKVSAEHRGFFGIFTDYDFPKRREINDDDYSQKGTMSSEEKPSQYSPGTSENIDDRYRQRSPLIKSSRTSHYSPKRSRTIGDEYRRGSCSPLISNDRHLKYSSSRRGVSSDVNGKWLSRENFQGRSYSPDGQRIHDKNYRQRLNLANTDRRSPYSPDRSSGVVDDRGQRSSLEDNEGRSQYSPDQRGVGNDSYGQRSSIGNDERHSRYSPDQKGTRLPSGSRRSRYSAYQREISASDEYGRRSSSPNEYNDHPSRYSPERKPNEDNDAYGNYYEIAASNDTEHDIEYRRDYESNQEFPPDIEEGKVSPFHDGLYLDEEPQPCFSDDEDNTIVHRRRYTFDDVEHSYGSDEETLEHDSIDTPEYYDKEQHKYLEDIMENNISETTLALDHAVFDGIRNFPIQLLELAKYYVTKTSSNGELDFDAEGTDLSGNSFAVRHDPRLNKGSSSGSGTEGNATGEGSMDRTDAGRRKKFGDYRRAFKPFPRKQACFYVYNPDNDSECEAVKHFMLKNGAQFLDVSDESNLKTMRGELRVLVRRKHKQYIHRISNLFKMKLRSTVKFALFNTVEDVCKKTKAYAAIFQYGGVLIPDDAILRNIDPALLEALLSFMAEQNAIHQKCYWVMNIRYLAYKKLGSQRPLTWRDAFVLDVLRKYRNERFVNIISKDYVLENMSPVQRYLDTALKQQLELLPTYRHFILLSDLNKQIVEVSWFYNRGIGFMDVREWLHLFAGEAKTHQLLSASKYTKDGSEYTAEGTRDDTLQYDTIDSPEDDQSIEPSSMPTSSTHVPTDYLTPSHEGHHQPSHLARSLSCNMVSRCSNYNDNTNMKEKRLEILSSIKNVKTNLMYNKTKEDYIGIQGSVAKQRQYERSRSYEPRPTLNERVMPRRTDNHRNYDTITSLEKNGLPDVKEAQYPKASYEKRTSYHGNERHNNNSYKGTIPSSKSKEKNAIRVESMKSLGSPYSQHRKSPVNGFSSLEADQRAH